jgi:DNA polymerase-1
VKHILFKENTQNKYTTVILIKDSSLKEKELRSNYVASLVSLGLQEDSIIAFNAKYSPEGNTPVKFIKGYLSNLLPALNQLDTKIILVADSAYFKVLTGKTKSEPYFGYALPCAIKGYEHINIVLTINYAALFYNPSLQTKITTALVTLVDTLAGTHVELGSDIIHSFYYPDTIQNIQKTLQKLLTYPTLTCDIETFSLKFYEAGIGSISFAWDKHNGVAFLIDLHRFDSTKNEIRKLLKSFFESYTGTLIFHNGSFDQKVLIYQLWMRNLQDTQGLITGLNTLTKSFHDTKIIAYLATNSCAGNDLKLKNLAQSFAGNYAQEDIDDIRLIKPVDLLKYNLTDALATWYVFDTYYPKMVQDNQLDIYKTMMLPSVKLLLQTELNGMPINMDKVAEAKELFLSIQTKELANIHSSSLIQEFNLQLQKEAMVEKNLLLKVKVKPLEDFKHIVFNPSSNPMLQKLLHEKLGIEVTDTTDTGQPATGNKILKKHIFKLINEFGITEEDLL